MISRAETPMPPQPPQWRPIHQPMPAPQRRILPMIVEALPDPAEDVATQLLDRRILLLTGRLDHDAAELAAARLLLLDGRNHDAITLHVGCPAAEMDAALTLIGTIDLLQSQVTAIAVGTVGGAAVAVYAAADDRVAHPHVSFLLHDPKAEYDDRTDLAIAAEQRTRELTTLHERIARACGRELDLVAADMRNGKLLTTETAVAYGLVQSVTTPR